MPALYLCSACACKVMVGPHRLVRDHSNLSRRTATSVEHVRLCVKCAPHEKVDAMLHDGWELSGGHQLATMRIRTVVPHSQGEGTHGAAPGKTN